MTDNGPRHNQARPPSSDKITAVSLFLICLLMSLAGGFRWIGWGKDFDQYLIAYNTISPAFLFGSTRFEIGYELISWIFAVQLGASYGLLYFVLCFISLGFKFYLFNKYLRYPILACIGYLLLFYPIHEYTQIRAAVAIAFGFAGIHFLLDRRWIPAICLFALAPLFHSSIAVLIGLGTLAVFIPQRIALVVVPVGALLILVVSSVASNALASVFVTFNPLVYSYLDNVAAGDAINIFSGSNILYALTILVMIVTKVYKLEAYIFKFMFMLVFGYLFLFAFKGAPVIALRMSEVVMLSSIFCVFRIPLQVRTFYIHSLMLVNGIWFTYRAFVEGTLG